MTLNCSSLRKISTRLNMPLTPIWNGWWVVRIQSTETKSFKMSSNYFWKDREKSCVDQWGNRYPLFKTNWNSLASLTIVSLSLRERFVASVIKVSQSSAENISFWIDYCSLSWHHCGKGACGKLEKISERALCFLTRDKSTTYCALLIKEWLKWPPVFTKSLEE